MVDWLVVWGATKAFGVLVTPFLQDLAKDGAKDLAVGFFKDTLTHQFREKDPRQVATGQAIKILLQRIQQELKIRHKIPDPEIQHCVSDVKKFLAQKQVQEFLGQPFDLSCDSLDSNTLKKYWDDLKLISLPPNFNWSGVTEDYFFQVKTILDDPESKDLRDILQCQKLADIDKATQDIRKNTQEIAGIIPEFDLITYQEAILETYEKLKLDSLDTSGYAYNELKLWRIFTEQDARAVHQYLPRVYELPKEHFQKLKSSDQIEARDFNEEEIANLKRGYLEQPITPVLEIVRQKSTYKYTVILGDPGSGKSTLLQHLAVTWAKLSPQEAAKQDIPLLIELRTYVRKRENQECKNFLDFFHNCSGVIHHLNQHLLHEELKAGRGLVMFDGLDEIFDPAIREDIITDIHRFTNTYPNVQVIVTSRVIGYKADKLKNARFSHFMLQDLSAAQIQYFIQRWHNLTYDNQEERQRKSERLSRGIHNSFAIQELAGNPLLLTMMAILNRNQELPRDRAELYNQASRVLLHQWDVERVLIEDKRIDPKTIDDKDKQSMLREVAYKMQTSAKGLAGNLIEEADLKKILSEYLRNNNIYPAESREVAVLMINQLRARNFMLCFVGAEYYAFVHRTFLEYFCATKFVITFEKEQSLSKEQLKTEIFGQHWQDETWHEVLRLIAGMIDAKFVGEIIDYLMKQKGERENFSNIFLAAKCLQEVRNRTVIAEVSEKLLNELKGLIRYVIIRASSSTINETVNQIRKDAISAIAITFIDDPDTLPWVKQLATKDKDRFVRSTAVWGLAHNYKDDPDTLPILKQRATQDEDMFVRITAVSELAGNYKDDPDTLPILKQRATQDEVSFVRSTAVRELAGNYKDHLDTLPWLKQHATQDESSDVRSTAVRELTRNYKDDPDTLPMLKQRATQDESRDVRRTAVSELARNYKDDPDTLPMLKQRATQDESSSVRSTAVSELADNYKDDPDTLPWLKQLATQDESSSVRSTAVSELTRNYKDDPDTLPWLKQLATQDEYSLVRTAVRELARNYKDDPDTLPMLKQRATQDEDSLVRRTAVEELAYNYKDDSDTLPMLKQRATQDEDSLVRTIAVWGLAHNYKDDPDTLPILKIRATQDESSDVRRTAVSELARNYKDDPDTLHWLKLRATQDESSDVRKIAVSELALNYKDDPDTLPILKIRATQDESSDVRNTAVRELAGNYKEDPDTLPMLKRATQDESSDVRSTAVSELARNYKDDPDTLPMLKRATQDESSIVRSIAVSKLARNYKDDPLLLELLSERAINDPCVREYDFESNPRETALKAITQLYPNHPQTLPLLRDRAKNDPDEQVREFARKAIRTIENTNQNLT